MPPAAQPRPRFPRAADCAIGDPAGYETCDTIAPERSHPFVNPACHAIAHGAKADHPVKKPISLGQCRAAPSAVSSQQALEIINCIYQNTGVIVEKPMSEITLMLQAVRRGERQASEELLPLVYNELRHLAAARMAQEAAGQTLQATALVHEAWLRMVGESDHGWQNRSHFFAAASEAMRRILVDNARHKAWIKHGGGDKSAWILMTWN